MLGSSVHPSFTKTGAIFVRTGKYPMLGSSVHPSFTKTGAIFVRKYPMLCTSFTKTGAIIGNAGIINCGAIRTGNTQCWDHQCTLVSLKLVPSLLGQEIPNAGIISAPNSFTKTGAIFVRTGNTQCWEDRKYPMLGSSVHPSFTKTGAIFVRTGKYPMLGSSVHPSFTKTGAIFVRTGNTQCWDPQCTLVSLKLVPSLLGQEIPNAGIISAP
ncbi:hypothetical protein Btru_024671 [Bulinus truncatus]|nr:hypothetical protein Btru_024671 [Bulinus truncatus]